ncbi:BTAD domain-containing putative transcriptional regulator [Streptomyces sp. NBC_01614]|uniref:BTAD domain-containing putative transcriptional regulator n=1 Tax=Streptomyces sp. NBC_01614 TaxID=2975897 RepID=UPI003870056E
MPTTTAPQGHPSATALTAHALTPHALSSQERELLYALGCGLEDAEIADALALPEHEVAAQLGRVLVKLGLRDRTAAIVHAFDCGLVVPGQGPRRRAAARGTTVHGRPGPAAPGTRLRVSLLGPLRARFAGEPVDVGPVRQQAVLAALALSPGRSVSRQELLDGVWGMESPGGNVVPVYVYRLRKGLRLGECQDSVIRTDRYGYRLAPGAVDVDVTCMEELVTAAGAAERAGDPAEAVRLCGRALGLFRGEPLAGLPGPLAELERLRLVERRVALAQRKAQWQLRLGRVAEAASDLSELALQQPLNEPVAALLMHALNRDGRRAEALSVFNRTGRRLADELGVPPGELLCRARWSVLRGEGGGRGRDGEGQGRDGTSRGPDRTSRGPDGRTPRRDGRVPSPGDGRRGLADTGRGLDDTSRGLDGAAPGSGGEGRGEHGTDHGRHGAAPSLNGRPPGPDGGGRGPLSTGRDTESPAPGPNGRASRRNGTAPRRGQAGAA